MRVVISFFDKTTNMVKPWAEAGYLCYCVDIQHPPGETREGNIVKVGADIFDWLPPWGLDVVAAFFFPPCTDGAVSGARWFKDKGIDAALRYVQLFRASVRLAEWMGICYLIENPVSTISSYWRKPDYTFQPWQYGDPYSKKTCLWTGGGFIMPEPVHTVKPDNVTEKIWLMPPSPDRADKRAETPMGFARAVYEANK